jgi:hypothetical protein
LTETATKGLTGILAQRQKRVVAAHPWMEHSQRAFLPGVDITGNVEVDSFMGGNARRTYTQLNVAYMECSKVYDSMKKWHTQAALRAHSLPKKFIKFLIAHYDVENGRQVNAVMGLTEWTSSNGMAQGEITSPVKFD